MQINPVYDDRKRLGLRFFLIIQNTVPRKFDMNALDTTSYDLKRKHLAQYKLEKLVLDLNVVEIELRLVLTQLLIKLICPVYSQHFAN